MRRQVAATVVSPTEAGGRQGACYAGSIDRAAESARSPARGPAMVTTTPRLHSSLIANLHDTLLLKEGHFAFRSGRHTSVLLDRDRLLADPAIASRMGYTLAKAFFTAKVDTVATPSVWGVALAQWVAYFLEPKARVVHAIPTGDGERHIPHNLRTMLDGKRVLVVVNLIVSGNTLQEFADEVAGLGADIVGLGALWDLADPTIRGMRVAALLDDVYPAWLPENCPICASGNHETEDIPY
jgi:orotate phosphoribosyltransferase